MALLFSNFFDRFCREIETSAALRRHDFLHALQINDATRSSNFYAWYRLGCYRKVLELAKIYQPKTASDIVAISVSLAAIGSFEACEIFVSEHLATLRKNARFASEAARGIVKFIPSLSLKLCLIAPATTDLSAAAHLALGQDSMAQKVFGDGHNPSNADLLAGHFFLKANLTYNRNYKLAAMNQQLCKFGLTEVHLCSGGPGFSLSQIKNDKSSLQHSGPLVSIIVPAFNAERHIRMSVGSLLEQSYRNLEVVIVDDGSTDGTRQTVAEIAALDPRVRVISFPQNRGAYAARNAALKEALGEFVTVQDADDFAHIEKIERQVRPLLHNGRLVFSISDLVRVSNDGVFARREIYPLQRMNTSSLMFRRQLVMQRCGYWEEVRYGADSEYVFHLRNSFSKDQWIRLRQPLTFAADHCNSLTALVSTGGLGQPTDPQRIAYTEAYTQRWLQKTSYRSNG